MELLNNAKDVRSLPAPAHPKNILLFLRDGGDDQKKKSSKAWAAAVLLLSSIDADGAFFIEYAKDLCIFMIKVERFVTDNAFQRVL